MHKKAQKLKIVNYKYEKRYTVLSCVLRSSSKTKNRGRYMNKIREKKQFKKAVEKYNSGRYKLHSKVLKEILEKGYSFSRASEMRTLYLHFPEYIVIGKVVGYGRSKRKAFCCLKSFEEDARRVIEMKMKERRYGKQIT
jgi:hypothetical protein